MKKKLTLEQAWKRCLAMGKWIAKKIQLNEDLDINTLKREWMENHPQFGRPRYNCFFCEYDSQYDSKACAHCPGKLVSKRFHCRNKTSDFFYQPIKFYQKLVELNKKRKAK